jgi:hypothetical protein
MIGLHHIDRRIMRTMVSCGWLQLPREYARRMLMDGGLIDRTVATAERECAQKAGGWWVGRWIEEQEWPELSETVRRCG